MTYNINDKFYNEYPIEAYNFVKENGYKIVELEKETVNGVESRVFQIQAIVKTLNDLKAEKIAELNTAYNNYLKNGFSYNENYFSIDEISRSNLKTKIEVCEDLANSNYTWRNNAGVNIDFVNKAGLENLYYQFCLGAENAKLTKFSLKDSINSATIETINTITITF